MAREEWPPGEPGDRLGRRLLGHAELPRDSRETEAKLLEVEGSWSNPLVDGCPSGVCHWELHLHLRDGSNSLRPGPPSLRLIY